jgi:hypothetical protein
MEITKAKPNFPQVFEAPEKSLKAQPIFFCELATIVPRLEQYSLQWFTLELHNRKANGVIVQDAPAPRMLRPSPV